MIEDRGAMMELGRRVLDAADALRKCEGDLNEIIWKEVK
jgi:hypothetical protein